MFRTMVLVVFRILGIPTLFKFLRQRKQITVVYYHNVDNISFANQIKYLKRAFNIINLQTLSEFLEGKVDDLPHYPVLITFDDGHAGNYLLLDTVKQNDFRPTIFLTSNIIGTNKRFWFNIPFSSLHSKAELKRMPDNERLKIIESKYSNQKYTEIPDALTKAQVIEMSEFIDFQSHSMNHPCLPCTTDKVSYLELGGSKKDIEKILGKEVYAIAYPNGDYTHRELKFVKETGYKLGFASTFGLVNAKSNPYTINRISTNDTKDINEFVLRVTGVWFLLKKIKLF